MLYSSIGLHGAQSIGSPPTSPLVAIPIVGGSSTTIVYTADDWYRISSLKSNGSAIPGAVNARQYTWTVSNVSQDISNNAVFYPLPDNLNGYSVPTSWLMGFGHVESDPFGVGPGVHNAYLLNMNPYLSNAFTFVMNAIDNPGPTVSVGVKLLESVNGSAYAPQPSIYGTLFVDATTNLLGAPAWTPVASTQMPPPGVIFNTNGVAPFAIPADTNRFYRGRIQ